MFNKLELLRSRFLSFMEIRKRLRDFYLREIDKIQPISAKDLVKSAIVFSPHQDDETLGCGGTIIRKRQVGAKVKIVFMTDGSRSHNHLMPEAELIELRQQEAIKAAKILDVVSQDIVFLDFRDGELQQSSKKAIARVEELLRKNQPQELFIPYERELHHDHLATNQIVLNALKSYEKEVTVYEYPIWYWSHYPWTKRREYDPRRNYFKDSAQAKLGLQLLEEFNCRVNIEAVRDKKRLALAQHKTQMNRLIEVPEWLILADTSGGEWLECFFRTQEIFRRINQIML